MECSEARELMPLMVISKLEVPARTSLIIHMAECQNCLDDYANLYLIKETLETHLDAVVSPSPEVLDSIYQRVLSETDREMTPLEVKTLAVSAVGRLLERIIPDISVDAFGLLPIGVTGALRDGPGYQIRPGIHHQLTKA